MITMPPKKFDEIMKEIVSEGIKYPGEWNAIVSPTNDFFGKDIIIFRPQKGPIYQLKTFDINPYEVAGVGTKLSDDLDDHFLQLIRDKRKTGEMGVLSIDDRIFRKSIENGKTIDEIFLSMLRGKNYGLQLTVLGSSYTEKKPLKVMTDEQKQLRKAYRRLKLREGKSSMFG